MIKVYPTQNVCECRLRQAFENTIGGVGQVHKINCADDKDCPKRNLMTKKAQTIKAKLYFGQDYVRHIEFPNEKELYEFLDQLFTGGYGYAEISKKLYVNMQNIHYVEIQEENK